MGKGEWLHMQWAEVQKRNPELKKVISLQQQYMPIVVTEGDTISTFQEIKQTFPFLREMPYLYFPSEFIKHTSSQGLCLKNVQK